MAAAKPILVTGSHRSGSTWTGKMIARSSRVAYLQEPFNEHYFHPGFYGVKFDIPFRYVTADNEAGYYNPLRRTVNLQYNWINALKTATRLREMAHMTWDGLTFLGHHWAGHRPLFKDPFALYSAEWLAGRFNMDVIVLIRHPAAFVSSLKRFGWESPVHLLLQQTLLMRDFLEPLRKEMDEFLAQERTLVEQGAQFWKLLYYVVDIYRQRHPDWYFVRHEDLSRDPVNGFRRIFEYLSLPYTANIVAAIEEYTNVTNPDSSNERTTVIKLNSQANIRSWKKRLAPAEVGRVRAITEDVATLFYADDDWE